MDQRKYERIKARLMQKKREAGDALKEIAQRPANPLVSREYGKAMDRYQKAKEALERHYENQTVMRPQGPSTCQRRLKFNPVFPEARRSKSE